jgi:hypothetical protein
VPRIKLEEEEVPDVQRAVEAASPATIVPPTGVEISSASAVVALQRSAGNQAVCRAICTSRAMIARDKGFDDAAAAGGVSQTAAPVSIQLPTELSKGLEDAWKDSFPGGTSQEQIGLLVRKKDGSYAWKRSKTPGTSGSAMPNYGDLAADETLIAVAHTHPYDKSEGEHKNVSFSGTDLFRMVTTDERMAVVNAGETEFVAVKTTEWDTMVSGLDAVKKQALKDEMKKLWDDTFAKQTGKLPERVEPAVAAVCEKYHLLYYKGAVGGTLNRVVPKVIVTPAVKKAELDDGLQAVGAAEVPV